MPVLAQATPSAAEAQPPVAPIVIPKFEITRYIVEGNTLLPQEELERVLAPFTGKNKDFGDVQRALEALQAAYQARGYGSVEIRLPEQELERGEVRFRAIEAKVGRITVEGNQHFSSENIRRSVPSLREGETPNSRAIAASIRLANENPAKQSSVLLRGTEREDRIEATIRVADIKPTRYSVSLDNTGNKNTQRLRLGLAFQHANLFDRDHVLTAQFLTAPENFHDVAVYGVGYKLPLYSRGDSIDLVAGYSDVDSGTVQDLFVVTGKGTIFAARYNQSLPRWGDVEHKITYGLDYRAYQNRVVPVGGVETLVPDATLNPLSVTYNASMRTERREWGLYLSMSQNFPALNDGKDSDFKKVGARFPDGTAGYRLFRAGFHFASAFANQWQLRVKFDAQYTDDALLAGEQFAIGGADNVRGFNERYRTDDKGYRTNFEIYTPDWAKQLGLENGRLRFLVFYDTGVVRRNRESPGLETEGASLDSAGIGLRMSYRNFFTARLDIAHVYHDGTGFNEPTGRRNSKKAHFSMAWVW
ncbi:MAG TPA: ShlB/FhaC/HecB family hemolysin secretion/activation protein [Burkholderiales bacterium]|nr:ShlB/FhaC/HecB family hemolysin secretion/activation protein [Burkholderiales bacterium]